jgi:hypothetical protein
MQLRGGKIKKGIIVKAIKLSKASIKNKTQENGSRKDRGKSCENSEKQFQ